MSITGNESPEAFGVRHLESLPGDSDGKESTCNTGDLGSIPGLGRSPGEGNGTPLQYSGLESAMDRGAWQATVHGVTESDTTERRSTHVRNLEAGGALLEKGKHL